MAHRPRHGERKAGFAAALPRFGAAGGLLALAGTLMFAFAHSGEAFFPAYRTFSKTVVETLATIMAIAPFALWDILAIPLALALVITFVRAILSKRIWRWASNVCIVLAALVFFLVGAWGLNHYAPPLSAELELQVGAYSADELSEATAHFLDAAAKEAADVPRESDFSLQHQDFYELAGICGASYRHLAQDHPIFQGSTAPVKALLVAGEPLLHWGNTGIFWPFTGEANVPLNCADADIPFIMCHEAAHRLGLASEQEANFAAFLACNDSGDARLRYSGNLQAFAYCFNALSANYPERAQELLRFSLDETSHDEDFILGARLVFHDWNAMTEHYRAYEGPVREAGSAANDTYLKAFSQEEGVKSYGMVVDYLIAWHDRENR